jgi:predicted secreted protein
MFRTALSPFLLVLASSACVTSGYERASATADKTSTYRENLVRLGERVGLATEALRALSENPGDSPRSNRETFETFARELANLEASAESSRKTYGRMDGRAESFFGSWTEDSARIANADLKKSAETRRSTLQANYEKLAQGQLTADRALEEYVQTLTDLRLYLEHDLTAAGIASARRTIQTAFADGAALQTQLHEQVRITDEAHDSIAPLQDLAPSHQAHPQGSRVR